MRYLWLALLLTLGLLTVAAPTTQASAATGCSASYSTASQWTGGFVAGVTVTDTGSTALTGWTVTFTFGGDQQMTSEWNASLTQSIDYVTASSLSYNGSVAAGGSTSFGFQGTYSTSDAAPTSVTCTPSSTVTPAIVASPSSQPVMQGFTSTFAVALSACGGSYIDSLTTWLNSQSTSYLAWAWDAWGSCPSVLITDYAGDPTPYGAAYQAILQALP